MRLKKQFIIVGSCFALACLALAISFNLPKKEEIQAPRDAIKESPAKSIPQEEKEISKPEQEVIGLSVQGRKIEAYSFGSGKIRLIFIGGIHGGYEWNSVLLAYKLINYLKANPELIPKNLAVTIIPAANPDGLFKVTGKDGSFEADDIAAGSNEEGRLNANSVDLNRNFDCNWKAQGIWRQKTVSGGTAAFSEPEAQAIRDYVLQADPAAVVFWHSKSNTIYGSMCGGDMLDKTVAIMDVYSKASGYKTAATFDSYQVTGDASDWLASVGIPAMTVELATHEDIEWEKNLAGIKALLEYCGNKF